MESPKSLRIVEDGILNDSNRAVVRGKTDFRLLRFNEIVDLRVQVLDNESGETVNAYTAEKTVAAIFEGFEWKLSVE